MAVALKIENLNKSIGKRHILHDISFETYTGEVFGFLGPNGAGKTTTIKMIVGLLSIDEGSISVVGYDVEKNFEKAMAGIGGIVENPELYKYMTGMQNLEQYARMRSGVTRERILEVVELVGLSKRINEKVSRYSLGMRQRLGVAQAILHHPKVLILDEPTNGLDPAGIKELRDILKNLAHQEGISVLVSSHLMSEMELMCDRVGIIVEGKLRAVHTVEEMISIGSGEREEYVFTVDNAENGADLLSDFIPAEDLKLLDERHFQVTLDTEGHEDTVSRITKTIVMGGERLLGAAPVEKKKLEDVFIELTGTGGNQIG